MKVTKLLIIASLSFCFFTAKAQWRLGAEAGIDLSSVDVITNHTQIGSHGGLTADYAFKNRINLSTGIFHTMKGANTICADDLGYEIRHLPDTFRWSLFRMGNQRIRRI